MLGYAIVLSLVAGIAIGFAPALQASKPNLLSPLKDEGTSFGQRLSRSRLRNLLVVAEISVCVVLLSGAGLLVQGLKRAQRLDPGFDTGHVLVVSLDLESHGYDDVRAAEFHRELSERLQSVPGVKTISVASLVPLGGVSRAAPITLAEEDTPASVSSRLWDFWVVSANYFENAQHTRSARPQFQCPGCAWGPARRHHQSGDGAVGFGRVRTLWANASGSGPPRCLLRKSSVS